MPIDEVLGELKDIEKSSPRIDGTLEVHKIARSFSTDGVCKLEFFKTTVDEQPFHVQYYKKDGNPDVCGHTELPLCYNPDQTCAECHSIYAKGQDWLECNLCDQWFHEECFFFRCFLKYCSKTIFIWFRWFSFFYSILHEIFVSFVTDGQVFEQSFGIIS